MQLLYDVLLYEKGLKDVFSHLLLLNLKSRISNRNITLIVDLFLEQELFEFNVVLLYFLISSVCISYNAVYYYDYIYLFMQLTLPK